MDIEYSIESLRSLRRCQKRALIRQKIEALAENPSAMAANVIRLQGRTDFRLRVQDWRIIFRFEENRLLIMDVKPRGAAYEVKK